MTIIANVLHIKKGISLPLPYNKVMDEYKEELDAVRKYIDNDYIYQAFYLYGFSIDGEFIKMAH